MTLTHVVDGALQTPESIVQTVAWDQRFGRRFFFKAAYLHRNGSHAYIVDPDPATGVLTLASSGASKYWEVETTGRFLASEHRDVTVSYVRSHSTRDLNDYDQFYGNFRNPIIRPNEHSLSPTDVPNRMIVRGTLGVGGRWVLSPLYEWRSGFPWSAVDEFQDFVGPRNRSGRLPSVSSLDFTLARPWHFGSTGSPPASRSTTLSTPAMNVTCRPTSPLRTMGGSTTRFSGPSDSSSARPCRDRPAVRSGRSCSARH